MRVSMRYEVRVGTQCQPSFRFQAATAMRKTLAGNSICLVSIARGSNLAPPNPSSRKIRNRRRSLQVGRYDHQVLLWTSFRCRTAAPCVGRPTGVPQCLAQAGTTKTDLLRMGRLEFSTGKRGGGSIQPTLRRSASAGEDRSDDSGNSVNDVVRRMRKLLEQESGNATSAATNLVSSINQRGRAALLSALFSCGRDRCNADLQFKEADTNADGVLDKEEFANYVEALEIKHGLSEKPLTSSQILNLGLRAAIGMVGFGFVDNAVMIIAGDAIETSIGSAFGLSTLTAAGLGNAVSDLLDDLQRSSVG